jgi:hypothetical protein
MLASHAPDQLEPVDPLITLTASDALPRMPLG